MNSPLNVLASIEDQELNEKIQQTCEQLSYSLLLKNKKERLVDLKIEQVQFILTDNLEEVSECRRIYKDAFICFIQKSETETAEAKLAGAQLCLTPVSVLHESQLPYLLSQVIHAAFVPVKTIEFLSGANLNFNLYHLMPLNQKLVPIVPKGSVIDESRLKKLEGIGELYVKRDEVDQYRLYIESKMDDSSQGLKLRCRAQFLALMNAHSQLVMLLIDEEKHSSGKEAKWLYDRCQIVGQQLLITLSALGEAWEVVNNSSISEVGPVERSATWATYAGLTSFLSSVGDPRQVMMAALISNLGLLKLSPDLNKKLGSALNLDKLNEQELKLYKTHPLLGLEMCKSKMLDLSKEVESFILCSHERLDGTGFPNGKKDKIPEEAMLLQFCEMIDSKSVIELGQERPSVKEVRLKVLDLLFHEEGNMSKEFLHKMKHLV